MGGVCIACNAPVAEEEKDTCPNCESPAPEAASAEAPSESSEAAE